MKKTIVQPNRNYFLSSMSFINIISIVAILSHYSSIVVTRCVTVTAFIIPSAKFVATYRNVNVNRLMIPLFQSSSSSSPLLLSAAVNGIAEISEVADQTVNGDSSSPTTSLVLSSSSSAMRRLGPTSGPTVWNEFNELSEKYSPANLGQGFPDWPPPKFAIDALVECVTMDGGKGPHQYTRTEGHPKLVKQLAARYSVHLGKTINPMTEVTVTVGASQAIYLALQALIEEGDEVLLFEPFFDLYVNQIKLAGGVPVYVPLVFKPYNNDGKGAGEWILDPHKLKDAITSKTRALILNSPHNPTGKIFTQFEMEQIANVVTSSDTDEDRTHSPGIVVLSDEVYKYIVHAPPKQLQSESSSSLSSSSSHSSSASLSSPSSSSNPQQKRPPSTCPGHIHFASLPNMYDRTLTISSAGKTFSATGWQVGWMVGPSQIISRVHRLLPHVQFCASTVVQEALARTLPLADEPYKGCDSYYDYLRVMYTKKRNGIAEALDRAGFDVPDPERTPGGGFFLFARIGDRVSSLLPADRGGDDDDEVTKISMTVGGGGRKRDWNLCRWMVEERGLLCIPGGPFFADNSEDNDKQDQDVGEGVRKDEFVRVAFCKTDDTLEIAAKALDALGDC